jgi:IS5 family transposase
MTTHDMYRPRLDAMIDTQHPLALLARRLPWQQIEDALAPAFTRHNRAGRIIQGDDLFGPSTQRVGAGVSNAGRPRLSIRLMASLLYLKHAFNLSDSDVVQRWSQDVVWQYFSGNDFYEPRLPCDPGQIGRFRKAIGEAGVEELLKASIDTAVHMGAIKSAEFERIIVDSTVQEKAIAFPTDSRLLEVARHKLVKAAKSIGIELKQTFVKEGKMLRRKSGGYAHARQYRRLHRVVRRQRTICAKLMREIERKMTLVKASTPQALQGLRMVLERVARLLAQRPKDKNKLYALHAPEVECISKGKAKQPYEFGVKSGIAVTHKSGLIVGARTFAGNPYDGHTLNEQIEQVDILCEAHGVKVKEAVVDLGYRGVDADNPGVLIKHRGWIRSMTNKQREQLKRRQAVEPVIGHLKAEHRMGRCWPKGALGDAMNTVMAAAGFNLRWLMRAVVRLLFLWAGFAELAKAVWRRLGAEMTGGHSQRRLPRLQFAEI